MIDLEKLLSKKGGYMVVGFNMIRSLGMKEAVLLSYIVTRYRYFKDKKKLHDGCSFYTTRAEIEKYTRVSERSQRIILDDLYQKELIDWFDKGIPLKRYYKPNWEKIEQLIMNPEAESEEITEEKVKSTKVQDPLHKVHAPIRNLRKVVNDTDDEEDDDSFDDVGDFKQKHDIIMRYGVPLP